MGSISVTLLARAGIFHRVLSPAEGKSPICCHDRVHKTSSNRSFGGQAKDRREISASFCKTPFNCLRYQTRRAEIIVPIRMSPLRTLTSLSSKVCSFRALRINRTFVNLRMISEQFSTIGNSVTHRFYIRAISRNSLSSEALRHRQTLLHSDVQLQEAS